MAHGRLRRIARWSCVLILWPIFLSAFSQLDFLFFHFLVELSGVVVALCVFTIGWYTRSFASSNLMLLLALGYLPVAGLDLLHLLTYKGMSLLPGDSANTPTQLWIAARYLEALTILVAVLLLKRRPKPARMLALYSLLATAAAGGILATDLFPDCYLPGQGLTRFKVFSEYLICGLLAVAAYALHKERGKVDQQTGKLLQASIAVTIASELSFTLYTDVYGITNVIGHLLKTYSVILIYLALVRSSLVAPYRTLFRDLTRSQRQLQLEVVKSRIIQGNLVYLGFHDRLTSLYNRAYLDQQLELKKNSDDLPLSIAMGDVDGLKLINDAFGHKEGDRLLLSVASMLKRRCGQRFTVGRWSGDEFLIIMPRTPHERAARICRTVAAGEYRIGQKTISFQISWGVATKEDPAESLEAVLQEAENRMYRHKLPEHKSMRRSLVNSLLKTFHERTPESKAHGERLQQLADLVGREIGLTHDEMDDLKLLAALHDIGKVAVPDAILLKNGALTDEEREILRKHPETGYHIARSSPDLSHIAEAILSHHEHWNGGGYPRGLKGQQIPLIARIIAIVDTYDAITHPGPGKQAKKPAVALKEIEQRVGRELDPQLTTIFLEAMRRKENQEPLGKRTEAAG